MPESAEQIVERFSRRPGYTLVTYREVALPHWSFSLNCRLLRRKELPTIDEFILRSVQAGLRTEEEVTSFLGLPTRVMETVMGGLISTGHLAPSPGAGDTPVAFALTLRGQQAVRELAETVPEEKALELAYDGLVRRYCLVDRPLRWRPRDLREQGFLEIPAFPPDPPEPGPKDTAEVSGVLADALAQTDSTLLSVLGLSSRREKFFLKALALVFQADDRSGDTDVQFVVDGRSSPAHDAAFASAEGKRKLGLLSHLAGDGLLATQREVSKELLHRLPDPAEVARLRRITTELRERHEKKRQASLETPEGTPLESSDALEEATVQVEKAESVLERFPVRLLEVHEHPGYLRDALTNAQQRVLIVSPWIRAKVVNSDFRTALEARLKAGVRVCIAHGIDDGASTPEWDRRAEEALHKLAQRYENFTFARLGDTHAKVLAVDDRYVIVTSFNWLSYQGDPNRPFRDERGTLVTVATEIERIYDDYMRRVSNVV